MPDWAAIARAEKAQELASASISTNASESAQIPTQNVKKSLPCKANNVSLEPKVNLPRPHQKIPKKELTLLERMSSVVIDEQSGVREIVPLPQVKQLQDEDVPKAGWTERSDEQNYKPVSVPRRRAVPPTSESTTELSLSAKTSRTERSIDRNSSQAKVDGTKARQAADLQAELNKERQHAADLKLRNQSAMSWASAQGESDDRHVDGEESVASRTRGGRRARGKDRCKRVGQDVGFSSGRQTDDHTAAQAVRPEQTQGILLEPLPMGASWADCTD